MFRAHDNTIIAHNKSRHIACHHDTGHPTIQWHGSCGMSNHVCVSPYVVFQSTAKSGSCLSHLRGERHVDVDSLTMQQLVAVRQRSHLNLRRESVPVVHHAAQHVLPQVVL